MPERVIFLHGWSVEHTRTYGWLPERLAAALPGVEVGHIDLGRYVSFRDEVRMDDLVQAMEAAVERELDSSGGERFAVIAHSTGGAVARCWWQKLYAGRDRPCPMSHMIGLAPAQFGSALAQLGKGRLVRVFKRFKGVEPGEGILDWLELGSPESWQAGRDWIAAADPSAGPKPVFFFTLSGQQIDRRFYDGVVPHTGEMGSDGVVRVAAANLNASHVRMVQKMPTAKQLSAGRSSLLKIDTAEDSPRVPFALVPGASHSGEVMGIMRSVRRQGATPPVLGQIKRCLTVGDAGTARELAAAFEADNEAVLRQERTEVVDRILLEERVFPHDICSMLVVRVRDAEGRAPKGIRIELLGENDDPNRLPRGFLVNVQNSRKNPATVTFFFNHDILHGCSQVKYRDPDDGRNRVFRRRMPGVDGIGIRIDADPSAGFAHYHPCVARASGKLLRQLIRPHQTVLLDIVLQRIVREGTMRFASLAERGDPDDQSGGFKDAEPGQPIRQG